MSLAEVYVVLDGLGFDLGYEAAYAWWTVPRPAPLCRFERDTYFGLGRSLIP